ncbi:hypothetical protein Gdia_0656 [Gluconacetobacter diazotrophicus PA1 5]|nr:hypothetical protein Gdia_0656 [Gluconacetobacter diazotrophicus PA1 5]TWA98322.1 mutator family transposase [Gluconacetobacter diazotrophicus]
MARRKKPVIPDDVLDQVLAGRVVRTMSDADALLGDMKKALAERLLNAELDHHLDGEAVAGRPNCRNGYGQKTVLTDGGRVMRPVRGWWTLCLNSDSVVAGIERGAWRWRTD